MHTKGAIDALALTLGVEDIPIEDKLEVIKLLTVICIIPPDGHRCVSYLQNVAIIIFPLSNE
jgi:hypothetical protein